jgi:hypothetical protein
VKAAKTKAYNKKHAGTKKHAAAAKHHPTASKASPTAHAQKAHVTHLAPKAAKARALSPGDVSCCSARALAATLRLTGHPVNAADVLALYRHTADSPDAAASIWATLKAACRWGLAGVRPVSFAPVEFGDPSAALFGLELPEGPHAAAADGFWLGLAGVTVEECWAVTWP